MQDVLRMLYQKERPKVVREPQIRHEKNMNISKDLSVAKSSRRYPQALSNYTQSTNYDSLDGDAKSQQKLQKAIGRSVDYKSRFNTIDNTKLKNRDDVRFPPIKRRQSIRSRKKVNQFRVAGYCLLFVVKLKRLRKKKLLCKRNQALAIVSNLNKLVEKMVHSYYANFLEQQLSYYVSLLELKLESPKIDLSKQVLNNLFFISKKLAESTVRRDFLQFLLVVSKNSCFFPTEFLTEFQINRLEFSPNMGCLINATKEQTRLIVGMSVCIKLFCGYILYRPWLLKMSKTDFSKNFQELQGFIADYGSIFYYLVLDEFSIIPNILLDIPQTETLAKFKLFPMEKIDIYPYGYQRKYGKQTVEDVIPNQNRDFLKKLMRIDQDKVQKIKRNLMKWIDRVTSLVLKHEKGDEYIMSKRSHHMVSVAYRK